MAIDWNYFLLPEDEKRRAMAAETEPSLDELMGSSYPNSSINPPVVIPTAMPQQKVDPETMGYVAPKLQAEQPTTSLDSIPKEVLDDARYRSGMTHLSNFAAGLGQSGRNFRVDPLAAQKSGQSVINDYLARKNAEEANRRQALSLDLQNRKLEAMLRPKPVDPIEQAQKLANLQKTGIDIQKGKREIEQAGTEEERKTELVDMINSAMKKDVATTSMSLKTLEDMASDIGLDPLKLRRAKAAGGGATSGKNIGYNREAQPKLASLIAKAATSKSRFLGDPSDRAAYDQVVNSPDLDPKQKREIIEQQGWNKEVERTQDRLYRYADETLKKISAPENGVAKMLGAINNLRQTLDKYPNVKGWNELSSTLNAMGKLGQWAVDLSSANNPEQRAIMEAVRKYNEAYRRIYSGAAIADHEKADFAGQLGAGAFSSPATLRAGLNNAEQVLRDGIWNTFSTIDDRVWNEYMPRVKQYLPYDRQVTPEMRAETNAIADKYRGK